MELAEFGVISQSSGGHKYVFADTVFNTDFCQIVFGFGLYLREKDTCRKSYLMRPLSDCYEQMIIMKAVYWGRPMAKAWRWVS